MYDHIIEDLRLTYDANALERDTRPRALWKSSERRRFLKLLQQEGKRDLQRFFSFYTDNGLLTAVLPYFSLVEFIRIPLPEDRAGMHVQRLFLRERTLKSTT